MDDKKKNNRASAKWQKEHPERTSAYCKKYYEKNKEKVLAGVRKYRAEHPEKTREMNRVSQRKRQARKKAEANNEN